MRYRLQFILVATILVARLHIMVRCQTSDDLLMNPWTLQSPSANALPVVATGKWLGEHCASNWYDYRYFVARGKCDNFPKNLGHNDWGIQGAVTIVAFPDEPVAFRSRKQRGLAVRIINRTAKTAEFRACESHLFVVCQALDRRGVWRELQTDPTSECGCSFHAVHLQPDQYWEFPAPKYGGPVKTKLRFRLNPGLGQPILYSNEFEGQVSTALHGGL
jgi:hypothetical protein